MANVERCAPVIGSNALGGIGSKAGGSGRVTVRVTEHVKAENGQLGAGTHIEVGNELVLVEDAAGLKLVLRRHCAGVQHSGKKLMDAVGVQVGAGKRG